MLIYLQVSPMQLQSWDCCVSVPSTAFCGAQDFIPEVNVFPVLCLVFIIVNHYFILIFLCLGIGAVRLTVKSNTQKLVGTNLIALRGFLQNEVYSWIYILIN